jgi:hypothetical protein
MSVTRSIAQRLTNAYVVTQDEANGEYGAYYFTPSRMASFLSNNASSIKQTGNLLIIHSSQIDNVMDNLSSNGRFSNRRSLIDMGKEYVIGTEQDSRLLVLRLVRSQETVEDGSGYTLGYVVVESNSYDIGSQNSGRFTIRVARC